MLLATGFTIMGVKPFRVANMIPVMVFAIPVSALWIILISPLL